VSKTDFVNSGSYFFTDRVVVFGIATFTGFGGSFFKMGLTVGFTDTKDFEAATGFLSGTGGSFGAGFVTALGGRGFFTTTLATTFFATGLCACDTDFVAPFLGAGLAGFFAIAFFGAFLAGFAARPTGFAGFLVAGFPTFRGAGFLLDILLPFF
jgi:hypothetical protein